MIAGDSLAPVGGARLIDGDCDLHDAAASVTGHREGLADPFDVEVVAHRGSEIDPAGADREVLAPHRILARRGEIRVAERALAG